MNLAQTARIKGESDKSDKMALKKEQFDLVLNALATGLNVGEACSAAGISRDSYYRKLKDDLGYAHSADVAALQPKVRAIRTIQEAGRKDWRACAWWLSHRYRDEFSPRREQVNGHGVTDFEKVSFRIS